MSVAGVLLVCDLDGTLLNARSEISQENRQAIQRFVVNGGMFTIATGRMEASVKNIAEALQLKIPAILYNGAVIYDFLQEQVVWSRNLPEEAATIVDEVAQHFPEAGIEIYQAGRMYFFRENEETKQHQIKEKMTPCIGHPASAVFHLPWQKALIAWKPEKLDEVEPFLRDRKAPLHFVRSEPHFLEILPDGVNKRTALDQMLKQLDLRPTLIVAMGDHMNDAELLQRADIGVAVENAHEHLKQCADRIGIHHERHAVAEVIEWVERTNIEKQLS